MDVDKYYSLQLGQKISDTQIYQDSKFFIILLLLYCFNFPKYALGTFLCNKKIPYNIVQFFSIISESYKQNLSIQLKGNGKYQGKNVLHIYYFYKLCGNK